MSDTTDQSPEDEVTDKIHLFLQRNFPQIQMHGGEATITDVDLEEKRVSINLSAACSGCGLSPMTTRAIKDRLTAEVDEIESVTVTTGFDGMSGGSATPRDDSPDAPF